MAIYTKMHTGLGYTIYRCDKRFIKTLDVPSNIKELLETQDEVNDENTIASSPYKKCIFCGDDTKLSRQVNQQTLYVCEKDFYAKTIGQFAQQVRLNREASHAEV